MVVKALENPASDSQCCPHELSVASGRVKIANCSRAPEVSLHTRQNT